jgi:hypothetical protein
MRSLLYLPLETELAAPVTGDTIENYAGVCRAVLQWRSRPAEALRKMFRRNGAPAIFAVTLCGLKLSDSSMTKYWSTEAAECASVLGRQRSSAPQTTTLRALGTLMKRTDLPRR